MLHNSLAILILLTLAVMTAIKFWRVVLLVVVSAVIAVFAFGAYQIGHYLHL